MMIIEGQTERRNNLGVFKRRTALNLSEKTLKFCSNKVNEKKFKKVKTDKQNNEHIQFFAKFQEISLKQSSDESKKPINQFKKQKKFEQILNNIQPRGGSFYRFGFKSYEKANKKLFAEVLNVIPSRMKGTIHVGEMWSTVQTSKFLKQNKIFINKMKLMDKLKYAKQDQQRDMMQSTNSLFPANQSKSSLNSKYRLSLPNTMSRLSQKQISHNSFKELNKSIQQIHKQLKTLKPFSATQRNSQKLKKMEQCIQKMNEIDNHYHQRIGQWI